MEVANSAVWQRNQTIASLLRCSVASASGLLLVLCCLLFLRFISGGLQRPPSTVTLLAISVIAPAVAGLLRTVWLQSTQTGDSPDWWLARLLPSSCLLLLAVSLSIPGSSPWALGILWFAIVVEEGLWWHPGLQQRLSSVRRVQQSALSGPTTAPLPAVGAEGKLPPGVTQQIARASQAGEDVAYGLLAAEFSAGERVRDLHLAFCPPMLTTPILDVFQVDGPAVAIKLAQVQSFGARIEIRLTARARRQENVVVEFQARCNTESIG